MNEIIPAPARTQKEGRSADSPKDGEPIIIEDGNYYEEPNTDEIDELLSDIEFVDWDEDKLVKHTSSADVPISNFLPVPVEDIVYDDGGERSRFFRVKGLQSENGVQRELPTVKVNTEDIANLNWVTSEWGFDALIFPPTMSRKDTLRSVMFMIGQKAARRKTIYTHTGWRE